DAPALGKQLGYASTVGAPFAAILGGQELAAGTVALKHLASGEQVTLPVAAAGAHVRSRP
ncbi:MAG: histidine--tRNA ligase, partial [Planctomycetes bacterium]|nr:histidine--tRNA ligase [Planctomycetota bacterium]